MNAIHFLSSQPWVERLGSTLLHFLWQGLLVAAVYAAARRCAARCFGPNGRYLLACAALAVMAAAPLVTWCSLRPAAPDAIAVHVTVPDSASAPTGVRDVAVSVSAGIYRAMPAPLLSWVVAAWFAGAIALWMRLLGGWILAERLRSKLVRPAPYEWQLVLDRLKNRIRVSGPVRLLVSGRVQAPAVVGWLGPVVLVPVGALTGLPAEHIEALLLHELAHIRRRDYLVNVLQSLVEALLFYHPAVWWVSGHIRAERELCCDDAAVSVTGDAVSYACALAELESARPSYLHAAVAAHGGSLSHRIARLLGESLPLTRTVSGPGTVAAALLLAATAFTVFGQPAARPKFEVASVKPSQGQGFMMVRPMPGRLTADASVQLLMQNAYTVQPFQIVGGPGWINSEHFAIEAKAGGDAGRAQLFLMLQSLLEDRFQLKIHRENRELPVYALVAARRGLKLPPPQDGSCAPPTPDTPPGWAGGRMQPPGQGPLPAAPCGSVRLALEAGGARMQGGKVTMSELTRMLSMAVGRSVIDQTGYAGLFDVRLDFVPDETTPAMPPPPPDAAGGSPDSRGPSILVALQEQLGLRLEPSRGPVEVLVVDRLERPSVN